MSKSEPSEERLYSGQQVADAFVAGVYFAVKRFASVDTHPQGGDATKIAAPFMSGAAGEAGTPKGTSHAD